VCLTELHQQPRWRAVGCANSRGHHALRLRWLRLPLAVIACVVCQRALQSLLLPFRPHRRILAVVPFPSVMSLPRCCPLFRLHRHSLAAATFRKHRRVQPTLLPRHVQPVPPCASWIQRQQTACSVAWIQRLGWNQRVPADSSSPSTG
jgi:hypothetical protein